MEKLQKNISLIGGFISIIIYINLAIEIYSYQDSFALSTVPNFKYPDISFPSITAIIFLILFVISNISKNIATSELDYFEIKRHSLIRLIIDLVLILVLIFVSKDALTSFFYKTSDISKYEVDFLVGFYYVTKNQVLTITVIALIDSLLTFINAKNNITILSCDNITSSDNKKQTSDIVKNQKPINIRPFRPIEEKIIDGKVVRMCPYCGTILEEGVMFCYNCGQNLK